MSLLDTASLIVTPNAYKEGKLYSVVPTDGSGDLSVTRATTATRVNSAGLVELVPYNIYEYSEQFDNGYWNKLGSTIGANSVVAPNGTTTADKVIETSTTADHYVTRASNFTQGLTYTISVYAKAGERNWLAIGFNNEAQRLAWFNLSTGVVGTVLSSVTATSIESVGNGWYRCSATMTAATNLPYPSIMIAPSNGVKNYLGNGTNGLFIWGAQFVEGASALSYQRTETRLNIPRLDYSNGSCPSLLVEPQRTNLALWSEQFDNVIWQKSNATLSTNSVVSPDGTQDADQVTFTSGGYVRFIQLSVTANSPYAISVWVKKPSTGGANAIRITTNNTAAWNTGISQEFTLTTEWQRIVLSGNIISSGVAAYVIFGGLDATGATDTDAIGIVHIWGAQLEAGSYATSYIPTTSASVTRNAEELTRGNVYTNNLITASGGTLFVDLKNNIDLIRNGSSGGIFINTGTLPLAGNGFLFRNPTSSSQKISIVKYISGTATTLYDTLTENVKAAIKWNGTTADVFVNGVKVVSATAFTTTAMENLIAQGSNRNLNINAMALWPTPLTDDELTALTTL